MKTILARHNPSIYAQKIERLFRPDFLVVKLNRI